MYCRRCVNPHDQYFRPEGIDQAHKQSKSFIQSSSSADQDHALAYCVIATQAHHFVPTVCFLVVSDNILSEACIDG